MFHFPTDSATEKKSLLSLWDEINSKQLPHLHEKYFLSKFYHFNDLVLIGVPLTCLHIGKRNNLKTVLFFSLERGNKLQMKHCFTENKQINEKETFFGFTVS